MAAGGGSALTRFRRSREAAPTLGIEEVPNTGHFLMREAPEAFNAQLRAMLSRLARNEAG
jgi:pimeloyl-ACP methyl ester carboxylesterase